MRVAPALLFCPLFACALTHARSAQAGSEDALREEAAERFERGVRLYESEDFAGALAEFEAAHRARPNPAVLFNIAITEKRLFRYGESVRNFERYLAETGSSLEAAQRAAVERELAEIRALVAEVVVHVEGAPADVDVDGRTAGRTPLERPLLIGPGEHVVRAKRGDEVAEQSIQVVSGERVEVSLAPRSTVRLLVAPAAERAPEPAIVEPEAAWYERWWIWAAAAAVVGGGAAALTIGLSEGPDEKIVFP